MDGCGHCLAVACEPHRSAPFEAGVSGSSSCALSRQLPNLGGLVSEGLAVGFWSTGEGPDSGGNAELS